MNGWAVAGGMADGALGGKGASYGNVKGINASWKQLFKRGFFDRGAREYFKRTAHREGEDYVLTALKQSLKITAMGSGAVTGKNIRLRI